MSKILVVEPSKMLRQAIVRSLFPDHEVQIAETLSDSDAAAPKEYDVLIVDAAALREKNGLNAQTARAVQNWRVPVIWLESEDESSVTSREKFVVLRRPIAREPLLAALAQCLGHAQATRSNGKVNDTEKGSKGTSKPPAMDKERKTAAGDDQDAQIIELVDIVVEEGPRQQRTKTGQRTTNK
ncbi:MAG: hypothetical protein ACREQ7_05140 [Candidatus Binatia bacterium]